VVEQTTIETCVHLDALHVVATSGEWTSQHKEEYNWLDQELTQVKLLVESKCRKLHAGNTLWTPALSQAIQWVQYWKGVEKQAQGGKISTMVLK